MPSIINILIDFVFFRRGPFAWSTICWDVTTIILTPRSFDIFSQKLPLVKTAAGTCTCNSMLPGLPGLQTCKARKDPTMHVSGRLTYGSTMVHVPVEDGRMIKSNYQKVERMLSIWYLLTVLLRNASCSSS